MYFNQMPIVEWYNHLSQIGKICTIYIYIYIHVLYFKNYFVKAEQILAEEKQSSPAIPGGTYDNIKDTYDVRQFKTLPQYKVVCPWFMLFHNVVNSIMFHT